MLAQYNEGTDTLKPLLIFTNVDTSYNGTYSEYISHQETRRCSYIHHHPVYLHLSDVCN